MIPTFRLLLFLLLGSLLVAGVALSPALLWLALAYLAAVGGLVVADYLLTTRPGDIEVERITRCASCCAMSTPTSSSATR